MSNTIDILGDEETFKRLVEGTIEEFCDDTINQVRDYAFYNTNIKKFSGPNVTTIKDFAFYNCSSLEEITTGNLTSIGDSAFRSCSSLARGIDGSNLTSLGAYAFYACNSLSGEFNGGNVKTINTTGNVFFGCKLKRITFPYLTQIPPKFIVALDNLEELNVPNVTYIYYNGIYSINSDYILNLNFPNVTQLGYNSSYEQFSRKFNEVIFDKLESLPTKGYLFFGDVNNMDFCAKKLIFKKLKSIPDNALYCAYIGELILLNPEIVTAATNFIYYSLSIKVPYNLVDGYKSATNWSNYADRITYAETPTSIVSIEYTIKPFAGRMEKAVMHYTATCNCSMLGEPTDYTIEVTGDVESGYIGTNPSSESSREVSAVFELYGSTYTETITQEPYNNEEYIEVLSTGYGSSYSNWEIAPDEYQLPGYLVYIVHGNIPVFNWSYTGAKLKFNGVSDKKIYIYSSGRNEYGIYSKYYDRDVLELGGNYHDVNKVRIPKSIEDYTECTYSSTQYTNKHIYINYCHYSQRGSFSNGFFAIPKEYL